MSKKIQFKGKTYKSFRELCEDYNAPYEKSRKRFQRNWAIEESLFGKTEIEVSKVTKCNFDYFIVWALHLNTPDNSIALFLFNDYDDANEYLKKKIKETQGSENFAIMGYKSMPLWNKGEFV